MCGIFGISGDFSKNEIENLFLESSVRGKHATGCSFIRDGEIVTIKEPVLAEQFIEQYDMNTFRDLDGSIAMIGHCRYSTSDLEYNQPISDKEFSLVLNGVISQEPPENWETLYGIKTQTKNDAELLFATLYSDYNFLFSKWPNSSFAAIELRQDKSFRFYRNEKRPLYYNLWPDNSFVICSTKDICKRALGIERPIMTSPSTFYFLTPNVSIREAKVYSNKRDLQKESTITS